MNELINILIESEITVFVLGVISAVKYFCKKWIVILHVRGQVLD